MKNILTVQTPRSEKMQLTNDARTYTERIDRFISITLYVFLFIICVDVDPQFALALLGNLADQETCKKINSFDFCVCNFCEVFCIFCYYKDGPHNTRNCLDIFLHLSLCVFPLRN